FDESNFAISDGELLCATVIMPLSTFANTIQVFDENLIFIHVFQFGKILNLVQGFCGLFSIRTICVNYRLTSLNALIAKSISTIDVNKCCRSIKLIVIKGLRKSFRNF